MTLVEEPKIRELFRRRRRGKGGKTVGVLDGGELDAWRVTRELPATSAQIHLKINAPAARSAAVAFILGYFRNTLDPLTVEFSLPASRGELVT